MCTLPYLCVRCGYRRKSQSLPHHRRDTQEIMKLRVFALFLAFFVVLATAEALPAPALGPSYGMLHSEQSRAITRQSLASHSEL